MRPATYLDFPLDEYRARFARLWAEMAAARLDGLLLTTRDNVEFLSGFTTPSWRLSTKRFWLAVPADREPVLFVDGVHGANAEATSWVEDVRLWGSGGRSNVELVADALRERGMADGAIGLELGPGSTLRMTPPELDGLRQQLSGARFLDCEAALGRARAVKSRLEIERIARACAITEAGHRAGFSALREGASEREVIGLIITEWLRQGGDDPANGTNPGYLSLQAGRTAQMTPSPADRPMQRGDLVQVDGGAVFRGYGADIYRNAYIGERLPQPLERYSDGARKVLAAVTGAIRPGVTSADLCRVAAQATAAAGMTQFRRRLTNAVGAQQMYLGHGIGFSLIEPPHIASNDETPWLEDMCGTVLVSFGDPEAGFIEWEDNFVVTRREARVLTPSPKEVWLTG